MSGKARFLLAGILTIVICTGVLAYGFAGYEASNSPLETAYPDGGADLAGGVSAEDQRLEAAPSGPDIPWEAGLGLFVILSAGIMLILFARIREEDVLDGLRKDIYEYIVQNPGEHLAGITRHFGISSSSARHHLDVLEWGERIVSHKSGKLRHFYPNRNGYRAYAGGGYKEILAALKNDTSRSMVKFLMQNDGANQKMVAAALGLHPSTVNWHARRLGTARIIVGERIGKDIRYSVNRELDLARLISLVEGASS